jgi:hypothetical protein
MARMLKAGVKFGAAFAQRLDRSIEIFFSAFNIGVDFLLMGQIKRDRAIDLLEG